METLTVRAHVRRACRTDVPQSVFLPGTNYCPICEAVLPLPIPGKAGRHRETCSDSCRDLFRLLDVLLKLIALVQNRCSPAAWLLLRGTLWAAVNERPWNRDLHVAACPEKPRTSRRGMVKVVLYVSQAHRDHLRAEARRRRTTTVAMLERAVGAALPLPIVAEVA